MKKLSVLGSTGSIGVSTLDVVGRFPGRFAVKALACGGNIGLMEEQVLRFRPDVVSVSDKKSADLLKARLKGTGTKVVHGVKGAVEVATHPETGMVVSSIVGGAGLVPTMAAVEAGKDIALANKETLVMAGSLFMSAVKEKGVKLLPVDSEHSAIFQSLKGHRKRDLVRLVLTASGGPFREMPAAGLKKVKPSDALKHPNWEMGRKITIDSSTLMNKGLEVIEARWLFDVDVEHISVLVHPQSIVHSMVEFVDGSVIAQLGVPDMKGPISYALGYPGRLEKNTPGLDLARAAGLTFTEPDMLRFPCLGLAFAAIKEGGSMPAVLNAANEVAVQAFLDERVGFLDIPAIIDRTMQAHSVTTPKTVDDIMRADKWARNKAMGFVNK
ncbi:MAG TPA: 1-deoxy-D-xylulose-5-phosphate reductoisomerase [Nitrospirota bacterium]